MTAVINTDPDRPLTPAEAADELRQRRGARIRYADYLRYWIRVTHAPFLWNYHWDYLADIMQAVADRDSAVRFSIINIPPRFAKSTIISQQWHPWMIGRENNRRSSLLSIGTTAVLASRDSRRTLDTIRSQWYAHLFPGVEIGAKETEAEWETDKGAYRIAVGTGGQIIGRGADHLSLDDPLKAEDSNSELVREKVNEWLGETLASRLDDQQTGTVTVIMQRLHERDPTGYLLDQSKKVGARKYTNICLPNEAVGRTIVSFGNKVYRIREDKELLHEERIGKIETAALKIAMFNNYNGQYQQNPIKMQGGHLDPRRFVRLKGSALEIKSRLGLTPCFYLDFASTEKQTQKNDPDYNVVLVGARDQLGRLIVLDVWRKQTADYSNVSRTLITMWETWRPRWVKGEKGAQLNHFRVALAAEQKLMQRGYFIVVDLPARSQDKVERSLGYQGRLNAGVVCVPEEAPWLADFEAEHRSFPNGAHDDQIDPCSDLANDFDNLPVGEAPVVSPTEPAVLLSDDIKRRIEEERQRQLEPAIDDGGW